MTQPHLETLEAFLDWWLTRAPVVGFAPVVDSIGSCCSGDVVVLTLFRCPPFQVQLFIVARGFVLPEHCHPEVDAFEVFVAGEILVTLNGKPVHAPEALAGAPVVTPMGTHAAAGRALRVRPNDLHGAIFGPSGGAFMSVQQWRDGTTPRCVASDYLGMATGPKRRLQVSTGNPLMASDAVDGSSAGCDPGVAFAAFLAEQGSSSVAEFVASKLRAEAREDTR